MKLTIDDVRGRFQKHFDQNSIIAEQPRQFSDGL